MKRTVVLIALLFVLPGLAAAQESGAGGSNSLSDAPYIPANDPECPAALSWDWFIYCGQTDPLYGRTIGEMAYHDHKCHGDLSMALLACAVGMGGSAVWCQAASSVCAAGNAWTYVEAGWNRILGTVSYYNVSQSEFLSDMPYGTIPFEWLIYW